jgi:hypothetical protein
MLKRLHVKYSLLLSDFNETLIFSTDLRKENLNIKLNQKSYSGSQVVPYGRKDERTNGYDKLSVAFHNFANAHKKKSQQLCQLI